MRAAERVIAEILASSGIPSARQRREILRELRCHAEDFAQAARRAGHPDEEIERMVQAHFGDPRQTGLNFSRVYRRERAIAGFSAFGLSTLVVGALTSTLILALQAGAALGLGLAPMKPFASRHTLFEVCDILATAAAYSALLSLERIFEPRSACRASALLTAVYAILLYVSALAGVATPFLTFGFIAAILLRVTQELVTRSAVRLVAVMICFGLFGTIFMWARMPQSSFSVAHSSVSWLIAGAGYQFMTGLAARVDRQLFHRRGEIC